eukprot:4109614-Pleurochrysis_carterae.AAC.1
MVIYDDGDVNAEDLMSKELAWYFEEHKESVAEQAKMVKAVQDAADNDANEKRAARLLGRSFTAKIPAGLSRIYNYTPVPADGQDRPGTARRASGEGSQGRRKKGKTSSMEAEAPAVAEAPA